MSRFLFFTKTRWEELPRLRHQLAHLLRAAGHEVCFVQQPRLPWQAGARATSGPPGIRLLQHAELLHHKLRFSWPAHEANAHWTTRSIRGVMAGLRVDAADIIVNFNYDYYFLRRLYPHNPLITILNDDFISSAPSFVRPSLRKALRLTCESSDRVLVTSPVLQESIGSFCRPELFLPWADRDYQAPARGARRDTLLFWGYVNRRVDFSMVHHLGRLLPTIDPRWRLLVVGPIEKTEAEVRRLRAFPQIEVLPPTTLDSLPLDRVFASLLPYRVGVRDIDAIVTPNKVFPLLARGLPLVITGMPRFMTAEFVFRLAEASTADVIRCVHTRFDELQPGIAKFVAANGARARLDQFAEVVRSCRPPGAQVS